VLGTIIAAAQAETPDDSWYSSTLDWLGRVGEILTALLAAIALFGIAWGVYRKSFGRRRDRYSRLGRLGTNAQISFFSSVLGDPPAMRRTENATLTRFDDDGNAYRVRKKWKECVWIDRDFYVHAVADEDDTIHAYSVTTRSKRFHPSFRQPGARLIERGRVGRWLRLKDYKPNPKVKLGKSRFHLLGRPELAASWIGAHNLHYFEAYRPGNPGLYQDFVYGINDAGYGAWTVEMPHQEMTDFWWGFPEEGVVDPQLALMQAALQADAGVGDQIEDGDLDEEFAEEPLPAFYDAFRRRARINTYTVLGPELPLDDYPFFTPPPQNYPTVFGPSSVRTRTLAGERPD
jgi:hypothetical protein